MTKVVVNCADGDTTIFGAHKGSNETSHALFIQQTTSEGTINTNIMGAEEIAGLVKALKEAGFITG